MKPTLEILDAHCGTSAETHWVTAMQRTVRNLSAKEELALGSSEDVDEAYFIFLVAKHSKISLGNLRHGQRNFATMWFRVFIQYNFKVFNMFKTFWQP